MIYVPLADRIFVEEFAENRITSGGIWVPDIATKQQNVAYGQVLSCGPGRVNAEGRLIGLNVKVGDVIAYPRKAPVEIPCLADDGTELNVLMMREADVIAIVHDMPRRTSIVDTTGTPLSMTPLSLAIADSSLVNQDAIDQAERAGWVDVNEHADEAT